MAKVNQKKIPRNITIPVNYYIDDEGKVRYDTGEMLNEFEAALSDLPYQED